MPNRPGFPTWFRILESVRKISLDGQRSFTAAELAQEAALERVGSATEQQLASGWLSKFVRWGYVVHDGTAKPEGANRWIRKYQITKFGKMCEPTKGGSYTVPLNRLIAAAREFEAAYGKKEEALAWRQFLQVLNDIDSRRDGR